ncbi:MAG: hypothetical protein EBV86_17060 [Marivivens sp.]|nr:hypothetical protein [Marivivens sp.]
MNRRRKTSYTDPYAEAAAARSAQRSTPQRYTNPFANKPANQPPQDPLVSAIAGGSTGGGFNDTITPTGINTNASGAFQEQTQGKTASGGINRRRLHRHRLCQQVAIPHFQVAV